MTKFSNGEMLRQRLPGGAGGGPEGAAGAAAPRRRRAGAAGPRKGRAGQAPRPAAWLAAVPAAPGGSYAAHGPGTPSGRQGRARPVPARPCPRLPPLAWPGGSGKRAPGGSGASPALPGRARRAAPPGMLLPCAGRAAAGAARPSRRRGAHGERRGEPRPGGRGRRGTYGGSRCGLGWAALILRAGRSWPPPRGPGCSAAVRK